MYNQDVIDKVLELKKRRYSQGKVAKELAISRSTVARYWHLDEKAAEGKEPPKQPGYDLFFKISKCRFCGLVYPKPKFLPSWPCPRCKKRDTWPGCWYEKRVNILEGG